MRRRKTMVAGILCGLACVVCVALYASQVNAQAERTRLESLAEYGGEQVEICVATRDLAAGEVIDSSMFEKKLWVSDLLPDGAIANEQDAVGKMLTSSVVSGEVLVEKRFENTERNLDIPFGYVAVSVPAEDIQAVGGAIRQGSLVDVYSTGGSATELIGESLLVLATNAQSNGESASSGTAVSWITLAVEPECAQQIVAAAQATELYFTLPGEGSRADSAKTQQGFSSAGLVDESTDEEAGEEDPVEPDPAAPSTKYEEDDTQKRLANDELLEGE